MEGLLTAKEHLEAAKAAAEDVQHYLALLVFHLTNAEAKLKQGEAPGRSP